MPADMAVELRDTGVSTLSLWPGIVRTEQVLAMGVDGDHRRDGRRLRDHRYRWWTAGVASHGIRRRSSLRRPVTVTPGVRESPMWRKNVRR